MLVGQELDPPIAGERLERLDLDQRHLPVDVRALRVGSEPGGITITLDADSRVQAGLGLRLHRCGSGGRDVNVEQLTLPGHRQTFSGSKALEPRDPSTHGPR